MTLQNNRTAQAFTGPSRLRHAISAKQWLPRMRMRGTAGVVSPQNNGCLRARASARISLPRFRWREVPLARTRGAQDAAETWGGGGGGARTGGRCSASVLGKHAGALPSYFLQPHPPLGEPRLAGLRREAAPLSHPETGHRPPDVQLPGWVVCGGRAAGLNALRWA